MHKNYTNIIHIRLLVVVIAWNILRSVIGVPFMLCCNVSHNMDVKYKKVKVFVSENKKNF
jgi:hypothetical protein